MKAWLIRLSDQTIVLIDFLALVTVIWATVEVCASIVWNGFANRSNFVFRAIWLRYARWLVAALSLQLAAGTQGDLRRATSAQAPRSN